MAFNAPVLTRRQRADRVRKQETAFFAYYALEARELLEELLEKYATVRAGSELTIGVFAHR